MKLTPSSTARRNVALASSRSGGSPQIPRPVMRIAPNPSRRTVRSPPRSSVVTAWLPVDTSVMVALFPEWKWFKEYERREKRHYFS